jgi:hypothetical protein
MLTIGVVLPIEGVWLYSHTSLPSSVLMLIQRGISFTTSRPLVSRGRMVRSINFAVSFLQITLHTEILKSIICLSIISTVIDAPNWKATSPWHATNNHLNALYVGRSDGFALQMML